MHPAPADARPLIELLSPLRGAALRRLADTREARPARHPARDVEREGAGPASQSSEPLAAIERRQGELASSNVFADDRQNPFGRMTVHGTKVHFRRSAPRLAGAVDGVHAA